MAYDQKILDQLAANPAEGLSVELKGWLDPHDNEDIAKFVKTCLALWNSNGGYLLIGFEDNGKPSSDGVPVDPKETYHSDVLQSIVSKYASYPIEIAVGFVDRAGVARPIIFVASGVRIPVVVKCQLSMGGKALIKENALYVRSLNANLRASTTEARRGDWERLVEIWMDNREADIARFIRRHLSDENLAKIRDVLAVSPPDDDEGPWAIQSNFQQVEVDEIMRRGIAAFQSAVKDKGLALPEHGSFETAMRIRGDMKKYSANESFLNLLVASNPRYSGWPFWVDTRFFAEHDSRPRVSNGGWQVLFVFLIGDSSDKIDFWRAEPDGMFYHRRGLGDDVLAGHHRRGLLKVFDWVSALRSVGEVVGTGLALARGMGCTPQTVDGQL
jgi:hypothetical protein